MARRATSTPPVLPGFRFVRPLGAGGFADVFLYEQDMPRRSVAVKVLLADAIDPEVLRRFTAEADVMARLSAHPSIVTIYQASVSSDGRPYLAMEFCPDSYAARYKAGPIPLGAVLDVGVRTAAALESAHRAGVLHRDIKPSNILVTSLGMPALADFGIATSARAGADEGEGMAMSIPWSSPEVVSERSTGSLATEVWSLGATLYTLLAGRSPFASEDREKNTREAIVARIAKADLAPTGRADVPAAVESLLARCMARDPTQRPASMQAVAEELRWIQFELGQNTSPLEIADGSFADAAPELVAPDERRGPVITTVQKDSRRAKRARTAAGAVAGEEQGLPRRGGAVVLAVAGVVIAGVVALVALAAAGVI